MQSEEAKSQLLAARGTEENFLALVDELYAQEIRSGKKYLSAALSELHNLGDIDLIGLVKTVDRSCSSYDFFTILHAFEETLPSLKAEVEDILQSLVHLMQQAGRDLAIGGVYGAFQHYCSLEVSRSKKSVAFILSQGEIDTYASFLSCSILAFHRNNITEAIQITESLITHKNGAVRSQAYLALGGLDVDETQADDLWKLLFTSTDNEQEKACSASLLRAILHFGAKFPSYWQSIEELLKEFVNAASPVVQYEISHIAAFQRIDFPERILHLLVEQLANVAPEHKGIIDNIDYLLVKLVEQGSHDLAINLLESIIIEGVGFSSLDYFSRELLSKHKDLLNSTITSWFLTGKSSLSNGVSELLHATGEDIELNADMSLLDDENKKIFACHKAVGWLFTRPVSSASFILSVYDSGSTNSREALEQVLYHPLLLSYPGEIKRYFNACIEKGNHAQLCGRLLDRLRNYHSDLEQVSGLKELAAPSENVNVYRKNFNKQYELGYDEAPKSALMQMIPVQHLLYGNSSIYYVHQVNGERMRQEMEMHSFSHSTEMPRLDVLDPENLNYMLRVYRLERMKNEADS